MSQTPKPFTCPEIQKIREYLDEGERLITEVRALGTQLSEARSAQHQACLAYASNFTPDNFTRVETAQALVSRLESQIEALRTGIDYVDGASINDIAAEVRARGVDWSACRQFLFTAWKTRLKEAESLLEPAEEGLVGQFKKLLRGGNNTQEAQTRAEHSTREGEFFRLVKSHIAYCTGRVNAFDRPDGPPPRVHDLDALTAPLPN